MKKVTALLLIICATILITTSSCDDNGDFLIFSIQNDITLGEQVATEIANDPTTFPILDRNQYSVSYAYLESMMNAILASDEITYRDEFNWTINIIDDDQTLNAFATPGGQIYVYTGLIYFLDKEDDLAGVIGHEIAHSDQRHSSKQLQRQYGISILLSILTGGEGESLKQIVGNIAGTGAILAFSRSAEAESDAFSVEYLADTEYACNGAAAFFQKLLDNEAQRSPEFLSTHPSPDNRVADINEKSDDIGCDTSISGESVSRYQAFRNSLP
ncbi:MAG: M48 family metalloprotease [Ekhidna sp.]